MGPETVTIVLLSITSVTGLVTTIGLFIALGRILAAVAGLERQATQEARTTTARLDALSAALTERPTVTVLRDVLETLWLQKQEPALREAVKSSLPADLTAALVIEALERIGVHVPPPPPELPDEQLVRKVRAWCAEGIYLAEEAARQNKKRGFLLEAADKRRVALEYVTKNLREERLTFESARLTTEFDIVFAQFARGELTPPVGPASDPRGPSPS